MKTILKTGTSTVIAALSLLLALGASGTLRLSAQESSEVVEDEPELEEVKTEADYRNWFDLSVGGNFIHGDAASFMQRHSVPKDIYGGVADFHYEEYVGQSGLFEIDGRGIFDADNYSLRLNLEHPDYGYVRAGYKEFRTWYDGSGGYLPMADAFIELYDDELYVDRGDFWFEGQLALPEKPILTFYYSHQFRDGKKSSTVWGDAGFPGGALRGIAPAFLGIDEDRDIVQLDVEHTLAETRFGAGIRYEHSDQDNTRNVRRRPGEAADRHLTHRERVETDMFNIHAFQETWFSENVLFTTGYSFTTLDTDIGGSRIYGADYDAMYDPTFARRQHRDHGFFGLTGGARMDQHVMNLNFMLTPWDNVTIVPSLRAENLDQNGTAIFTETEVGAGPAFASTLHPLLNTRDRGFTDVSEGLEVRYTGLTNWVLYTRAEWLQGEGDLKEREVAADTGAVALFRDTDSKRFTQKYVVGANWYPLRRLNFAAQYYHKNRKNDYDHEADSAPNAGGGNRYPAYIVDQDFTTDDVNFRVTFRPFSTISLVSRYDFQVSTVDSRMDNLGSIESAEITSHIFGESITWTPIPRLFLQGSINYAVDHTDTPAVGAIPGGDVVQKSENDYIDASLTAGYALTEKTDLQTQYFVYYSDNYDDNSAVSVPYGMSAEEHGITATLIHRINSAMQWTLKYGWFTYSSETYGGNNDYDAHMLYSSYRFRF